MRNNYPGTKISIAILIFMSIASIFNNCCKKDEVTIIEEYNQNSYDRFHLHDDICEIAFSTELAIRKDYDGKPPNISWNEIFSLIKEKYGAVRYSQDEFAKRFREVSYLADQYDYKILIILNYKAMGKMNYSVVKINNGIVYWKDNYASNSDKIEDVDWENVNYLINDFRLTSDLSLITKQQPCLPDFIP